MIIVALLLGAISIAINTIHNMVYLKMELYRAVIVALVQLIVVVIISMFVSLVFINYK